jgi:ADP-ribosyl-[dinitrogen reductase] hydrolase
VIGQAYGDALGVPYESGSRALPRPPEGPRLLGGGLGRYEPGEWSDDTQMAICVMRAADRVPPAGLDTPAGLVAVAEEFEFWHACEPADIGIQISQVLHTAAAHDGDAAHRLRIAAARLHETTGLTAGNGAVMRTAPVALALLGRPTAIAHAARAIAELTHPDPLAGDSCVLVSLAIDTAIRTGELQLADHVGAVPAERQQQWRDWIAQAEQQPPAAFAPNGYTVTALQAAWSALHGSGGIDEALTRAVTAGDDTDTVAAIAGALAGARFGRSRLPEHRVERLHGWPGLTAAELADWARRMLAAAPPG